MLCLYSKLNPFLFACKSKEFNVHIAYHDKSIKQRTSKEQSKKQRKKKKLFPNTAPDDTIDTLITLSPMGSKVGGLMISCLLSICFSSVKTSQRVCFKSSRSPLLAIFNCGSSSGQSLILFTISNPLAPESVDFTLELSSILCEH
jgi:hypothetical protein